MAIQVGRGGPAFWVENLTAEIWKKTDPIQPWWLRGLERVSNSSRHSLEGPRFESR